MRVKLPLSVAICMLAMTVPLLPANADPNWAGAGYYVAFQVEHLVTLLAGPYSTEEECKSHNPPEEASMCTYYAADPAPDDK